MNLRRVTEKSPEYEQIAAIPMWWPFLAEVMPTPGRADVVDFFVRAPHKQVWTVLLLAYGEEADQFIEVLLPFLIYLDQAPFAVASETAELFVAAFLLTPRAEGMLDEADKLRTILKQFPPSAKGEPR